MTTLDFNGYNVDVQMSYSFEIDETGRRSRHGRGGPTKHVENSRYVHSFETIIHSEEESRAFLHFLSGMGFAVPFNGGLDGSYNPIKPNPGYQDYYFSAGTGLNADSLLVASGQTITYPVQLTGRYTVVARCQHSGDGLWHTYSFDDAGNEYQDGVSGSYSQIGNWFAVDGSGNLTLTGKNESGSNALFRWDEIVMMPWRATAAMHEAWSAEDTNPFSPFPKLRASGDFIQTGESHVIVTPEVTGASFVDATIDGSEDRGARKVQFTLTEEPRWL